MTEDINCLSFFHDRFNDHGNARVFTEALRQKALARCTELRSYIGTNAAVREKITEMDWDFFIGATEILIRCKKVLKYCYVLAYFAKTDKTKENESQLLAYLNCLLLIFVKYVDYCCI